MAIDLQDLARRLFKAAETLWTNTGLRPDQYAQPVLALIALRQIEAKFLLVDAELKPSFTGRLKPTPAAYQAKGAMFVPEVARFSRLLALSASASTRLACRSGPYSPPMKPRISPKRAELNMLLTRPAMIRRLYGTAAKRG